MAKTLTGNRFTMELEFYWRGKRRIPSVNFIFERPDPSGDEEKYQDGLLNEVIDSEEFSTFSKSAHILCAKMIEAGELD